MKLNLKIGVIIATVAVTAMSSSPIMSTSFGATESGVLIVRGYNLMEFSVWGCVPVIAAFLIPAILLGCQSTSVRETALLLLLVGTPISYVHSFNAARAWLEAISDSPITYHPATLLYPAGFSVLIGLSIFFNTVSNKAFRGGFLYPHF